VQCEISGSDGDEYEDDNFVACGAVYYRGNRPMFQRCILPPSSGRWISRSRKLTWQYRNRSEQVKYWPDQWRKGWGIKPAAYSSSWWWRQYATLKLRSNCTRLHGATSLKAIYLYYVASSRTFEMLVTFRWSQDGERTWFRRRNWNCCSCQFKTICNTSNSLTLNKEIICWSWSESLTSAIRTHSSYVWKLITCPISHKMLFS
jgi:hypothetical protein